MRQTPPDGRLFHLALAFSQFLNVLIGSGFADEAFSAFAHRRWLETDGRNRWRRRLVNGLFFWQPDHCAVAYDSEVRRRHQPPAYSVECLDGISNGRP